MTGLIYIMKESGDLSLHLSALDCEKRVANDEYGDEKGCNESFRMAPSSCTFFIYHLLIILFMTFLQVIG